jgi:DUF4097 and DUF4098 domain-containing protein YvlB
MATRTIMRWLCAAMVAALPCAAPAAGSEGELINEGPAGIVEIDGQRRLRLEGLQGNLSLRLGKAGEMQYMARALDNRRTEHPVALWLEGSTLQLEPVAGMEEHRLLIEIVVPPELDVHVNAAGSILNVSSLMSELSVEGRDLDLRMNGMAESCELELSGGTARIEASEGDIELNGTGVEATLKQLGGVLTLTAANSRIDLGVLRSDVEIDVQQTHLVADQVQGQVRVTAEGGEVKLRRILRGAELELSECPLTLEDIEGGIRVNTDSTVQFKDLKSELWVSGYGAGVRGSGNLGGVHVNTSSATIFLESIGGAVEVEGSDLRVQLKDIKADADVRTSMSSVRAENCSAALNIENDYGDITVNKMEGELKINSSQGNVTVTGLSGTVDLQADGLMVEVAWTALPNEGDSTIANKEGSIRLRLPTNGSGRLEAASRYGRVDSLLPEVIASDDGKHAAGTMGRGRKPVIRVNAGGDIVVEANIAEGG